MDQRRRRSSILKKVCDDEAVDEVSVKLKRRISFSGKKSIRIFSGEEETDAWNNSYEESDSGTNVCVEGGKKVVTTIKLGHKSVIPIKVAPNIKSHAQYQDLKANNDIDKENIYNRYQYEDDKVRTISEEKQNNVKTKAAANVCSIKSQKYLKNCFASSLCTTMDFINNTHHIDSLHIENSVDVSLHDREYVHPLPSFSMEEFERETLLNAKRVSSKLSVTETSCRESLMSSANNMSLPIFKSSKFTPCSNKNEYQFKDFCEKDLSKENMEETFKNNKQHTMLECQAINVDEQIEGTMFNEKEKNPKRKTISNVENMDISPLNVTDMPNTEKNLQNNCSPKELSQAVSSQGLRALVKKSQNIDEQDNFKIEKDSIKSSDKLNEISSNEELVRINKNDQIKNYGGSLKQSHNMNDFAMDVSLENEVFFPTSECHSSRVSKEYLSHSKNKSINCEKYMEQTCHDMNLSSISISNVNHESKEKDNRKTILFDTKLTEIELSKLNESLEESVPLLSSRPNQNNKEANLNLNHKSIITNDENNLEISLCASPIYSQVIKSRECRKTIIFNDKTSKLDLTTSNTQKIIEVDDIKIKPTGNETCTNLDSESLNENIEVSPQKSETEYNILFDNNSRKFKEIPDKNREFKSFQKYINKKREVKVACNETATNIRNECDISLNNQNNLLPCIDMSSPLLSNEFIQENKKLNFRQLNDDIEMGKLSIFPQNQTTCTNLKKTGLDDVANETKKAPLNKTFEKRRKSAAKSLEKKGLLNALCSETKQNIDVCDSILSTTDKKAFLSESNRKPLDDTINFMQMTPKNLSSRHSSKLEIKDKQKENSTDKNKHLEEAEVLMYVNNNLEQKPFQINKKKSPLKKFYTKSKSLLKLDESDNEYQMDVSNLKNDSGAYVNHQPEIVSNLGCNFNSNLNDERDKGAYGCYTEIHVGNRNLNTNDSDMELDSFLLGELHSDSNKPQHSCKNNSFKEKSYCEAQRKNAEKTLQTKTLDSVQTESFNKSKKHIINHNIDMDIENIMPKNKLKIEFSKPKNSQFSSVINENIKNIQTEKKEETNDVIEKVQIFVDDTQLESVPGLIPEYNSKEKNKGLKLSFSNNNSNNMETSLTSIHTNAYKRSLPNFVVDYRKILDAKRKTLLFNDGEDMDLDEVKPDINEKENSILGLSKRHTFYNLEDDEMVVDRSITRNKPLFIINISHNKQISVVIPISKKSNEMEDTTHIKIKEKPEEINKPKSIIFTSLDNISHYESPKVNNQKQAEAIRKPYFGTPHRSMIEFEDIEKKIELEMQQEKINKLECKPKLEVFSRILNVNEKQKYSFSAHSKAAVDFSKCEDKINITDDIEEDNSNAQRKISFNSQRNELNSNEKRKLFRNRKSIYECFDIIPDVSGLQLLDIDDEKEEVALNCFSEKTEKAETSRKRTTINLTPVQTVAKKRNTQHFIDCCMDESSTNDQQMQACVKNDFIVIDDSCGDQHVTDISDAAEDICTNFENERLKNNSPVLSQISRIPIHIDSAKKCNSILTRFLSPLKLNETNMNHSLETIAIPRRVTKLSNNKDNYLSILTSSEFHNDTQLKPDFEDIPITISDVSVFYLSQKGKLTVIQNECNNVENVLRESSDDNTVNNIAKFKKRYMDLTCDSPLLSFDLDDIDKTRLSLVETLVDDDNEDDTVGADEILPSHKGQSETVQSLSNNIKACLAMEPAASVQTLKNASAVCRKCKRCQNTIINETFASASESFILPVLPSKFDLGLERLEQLRSKPGIAEVNEYLRHVNFNRIFTKEDFIIAHYSNEEDADTDDDAEEVIKAYKNRIQITKIEVAAQRCKQIRNSTSSLVKLLEVELSSDSHWIIDNQMQWRNLLQFDHRKLLTISLVISYIDMNTFGQDLEIKNIQLQPSRVPRKNWKPYSYVLDFQLKLEVPFDLRSLCSRSDVKSILEVLNEIDRICVCVEKLGRSFWKLVCKRGGSIIRELNSIYVRKVVRLVSDFPAEKSVENFEFKVEITNLRKICYKDIVAPPLHLFLEDIQHLPIGLDFLSLFLENPLSFLKN